MAPDPLFKGARRPATVLGIPLVPFYAVAGAGAICASLASIWLGLTAYALVLAVVVPILIGMRMVADTDIHAFRLLWVRTLIAMQRPARTRRFWGGASAYAPVRFGRSR